MKLPPEIPRDAEFFRAFARFEQVLKEMGFRKASEDKKNLIRKNGEPDYPDVKPDWDSFARDVEKETENQKLFSALKKNPEISYLIDNPPLHQVVRPDETLGFQKKPYTISTIEELLRAVRRVRNNLFHGAKTPFGPMNDPNRNKRLISASLTVFEALLDSCPKIKEKFEAQDW